MRELSHHFALLVLLGFGASVSFAEEAHRIVEEPISPNDRLHWAFQPVKRSPLPPAVDGSASMTPIDRFIQARLAEEGLKPSPPASRATLIRRLSYDLVGLPPTPDQIRRFEADTSPDAYDRLVDSLLASPHHGERWAQHWLDVARFAETDGFEHDKVRPNAWKFRDWVVEALNNDIPYDNFIQLQIAGDELRPGDDQALIATAFCLSGPDMPDINSMDERKHNVLNELTSTIGAALLGLQMECAQCHDHKYDPISQADFYRMRAIFQPAVHLKKNQSLSVLGEKPQPPRASYVMLRGDWRRQGPSVEPAFPRIATGKADAAPLPTPLGNLSSQTSGRRLALARWITSDDHLLTTRVLANRLWLYHFGQGLSRTPNDFGAIGDDPSHPRLLDWLAAELVREEWSLKRLHRLIASSSTYRQSSQLIDSDSQRMERDLENRLLSRFPRKRLEGEAIRDGMLSAAGLLSSQAGGHGVRPPLPEEMKDTLLRGQWTETPDRSQHYRRSIYIFARRNLRYPIFEAFDRPDGNASCPQRGRSTTAPQSLLMLNSEFSLEIAQRLAASSVEVGETSVDQIKFCFLRALGRLPTADEIRDANEFLTRQFTLLREPASGPTTTTEQTMALTDLCLALLNCNEFIYLD